jgi:maltose alpha-D-glucosyltransferase/alpha-amylase
MQLYGRGVRRRLAPMLGGDPRRLHLAFSLLFSLPGTPMIQYGDEIGIWDDLELPERECARTAMQWTEGPYGGFSTADHAVIPTIDDPRHGFRAINVAAQRKDPNSLLNQVERMIRMRRECQEISWGDYTILEPSSPEVLALRYDWQKTSLVVVHNFADERRTASIDVEVPHGECLVDVFDGESLAAPTESCTPAIKLQPYQSRWFRVGGADTTLFRREVE